MRLKNPWWVVVGAVFGLIVGNGPLMQFSFGVFVNPLTEEFQTDRATVSAALLVGLVLTGLFTPLAGSLVDRYGVRRITLPAIVLFAMMIAVLGLTPASPYAFIALYGVTGIIAAGQTPLPYAKAVAGAFEGRRGLALGVSMAGVGLGAALVPQLAQALIASYGWRTAYHALGIITFLCAFPAVFLFLKEPVSTRGLASGSVPGLTARETLGGRDFWIMALMFFAVALAAAGAIAHLVPILTDRGVSPQAATTAISIAGAALIAGRLLAGYLLDRVFAPYVAAALFLFPLVGICMLFLTASSQWAIVAAVGVGLGLGAEVDLIAFLISRYVGLRSFGQVYGYIFAVFMLGSGLGPFLMGLSYSRTGSYDTALVAFALGLVLACVLAFMFGPYRYPAGSRAPAGAEAEA